MKNPWKFENFKKGILTTIVGVALLAAAVYVYLMRADSEVFALALLGLGALAFGLKDPKMPPNGGAIPLLILSVWVLSSCVTYTKCLDKFGTASNDSVTIKVKVPYNDTVTVVTKRDSLVSVLDEATLNRLRANFADTLEMISESGKVKSRYWYDQYRRALVSKTNTLPDTIRIIIKDTVQVEAKCPPVVVVDPLASLPWYNPKVLWKNFQLFAAWAVLAGVIIFGIWLNINYPPK
jgi:hypothetical protein